MFLLRVLAACVWLHRATPWVIFAAIALVFGVYWTGIPTFFEIIGKLVMAVVLGIVTMGVLIFFSAMAADIVGKP